MASADGPIKTLPLRGIKDYPPFLHNGRLLTLEDTIEFFNLVFELKLNQQERDDLTATMRCLEPRRRVGPLVTSDSGSTVRQIRRGPDLRASVFFRDFPRDSCNS